MYVENALCRRRRWSLAASECGTHGGFPAGGARGYRRAMRPQTLFVLILIALAYLLGARAGRERYEQIVGSITSFWNDPTVKKARRKAKREAQKARKRLA